MNELKRFELIMKQDVHESIFIKEEKGKIKVDCSNFTGVIDLDKILLDNFDANEFLKNSTFILGNKTELIAEYQKISVIFGDDCQIYIYTEDENEEKNEEEIKIIGGNNNIVKAGRNSAITLNNNNYIYSGDNCKIVAENHNFIEITEEYSNSVLEGTVDILAKNETTIILPLINNEENNIIVGKNSNIYPKGYSISFR